MQRDQDFLSKTGNHAKYFAYAILIAFIGASFFSFSTGNSAWLISCFKWTVSISSKIFNVAFPYVSKLVFASITVVWLPTFVYILVSVITQDRILRFLSNLALICLIPYLANWGFFLDFDPFHPIRFITSCLDYYLILLWILPRSLWNIPGLILGILLSAIVELTPSLPGGFDDIGMITAIFSFIFFYIHTLAFLIQKFADSFVAPTLKKYKIQLLKKILQPFAKKNSGTA